MLRRAVISSMFNLSPIVSRSTELVGEVVNDNFNNFGNFEESLANSTRVGKQVTVNTSNEVDYIATNLYDSNSEKYTITLTGTIDNINTRVGIGHRSITGGFQYNCIYNSNSGKIGYFSGSSTSALIESNALTPTLGVFTMVLERVGTFVTATFTLDNQTITFNYEGISATSLRTANFRKYCILCREGQFTLENLTVEDNNYVDVDYIYRGDSITAGILVTQQSKRHFDLIANANTNIRFVNLSGSGNKIEHYNINEFDKFSKNAKIVLFIGTNNGIENQTSFTNKYITMISDIESLGFTVVTCDMLPRDGYTNIPSYNVDVIQAQGKQHVNMFSEFSIDGTTNQLHPDYDSGDGIHLNDLGNLKASQLIAQSLNLNIPS